MYFEITPPRLQNTAEYESSDDKTPVLSLAPFTANPKVFFENIPIGNSVSKKICIQNPTKCAIKLTISKLPPSDRNVSLSWLNTEINSFGKTYLDITWKPKKSGAWRDTLELKSSQGLKRDIAIIFKSSTPVKFKVCKPSNRLKIARNGHPLVVSKKIRTATTPLKKASPQLHKTNNLQLQRSPLILIQNSQGCYVEKTKSLPECNVPQTPIRRFTYLIEKEKPSVKTVLGMEQNSQKRNKFNQFNECTSQSRVNELNRFVGNKENNPHNLSEVLNKHGKTRKKSPLEFIDHFKLNENYKKIEKKSNVRSNVRKPEIEFDELCASDMHNQQLDLNVKCDYLKYLENPCVVMESTKITCISPKDKTPLRRETYSLNKKYSNDSLEVMSMPTMTNVTILNSSDFNTNSFQFNSKSVFRNGNNMHSAEFNYNDDNEPTTIHSTPKNLELNETFNSHSHCKYDTNSRLADKLNSEMFQFTPVTIERPKSETIFTPSRSTTDLKVENTNLFLNCDNNSQNEITILSKTIYPQNLTNKFNSTEFSLTSPNCNLIKQECTSCTPSFLKSNTPKFELQMTYEQINSPSDISENDSKMLLDNLQSKCNEDDQDIKLKDLYENVKDSKQHLKYSQDPSVELISVTHSCADNRSSFIDIPNSKNNFSFSAHSTPTTNNTFDISKSDSISKLSTGTYVKEEICEPKQNISIIDNVEDFERRKQSNKVLLEEMNISKNHNSSSLINIVSMKKNGKNTGNNYEMNYSGKAVKDVIEANLWASPLNLTFDKSPLNNQRQLSCIDEEETHIVSNSDINNYPDSLSDKSVNLANENDEVFKNKSTFYDSIEDFESIPRSLITNKRKSNSAFRISPPKRIIIHKELKSPRKESWSKLVLKGDIHFCKQNFDSPSKFKTPKKKIIEKPLNLHNPNSFLRNIINPDPFSATMTVDPFLSNHLYYDETWIEKQEMEFKKWLNALLTPPAELDCKSQNIKVDIAKLWEECRKKDLKIAPTKENISSKYHVNNRLNSLRKAACNLIKTELVIEIFSKITVLVEKKQLVIRNDRDLHLDVGLQAGIMKLILYYNPLWLRIGLEAVFGETIPLNSNSDVVGLSTFIMLRMFRDPSILKKHSNNVYLPAYTNDIKKFTLKKFLMLVFFLDYAKRNKLIRHDPCLFCTNALIKDSREILLSFTRELLSGIGDITKYLRSTGYVVSYKQSVLDEFDYAVKNLGVDLRDGVRLVRISEIILMKNDLSKELRVPAISRLQKIHNVKVALDALKQSGCEIYGGILPKDIADGHREKTLSLLWQLIYKFRAPRFVKATESIQRWWRSMRIVISRRISKKKWEEKLFCMKINSAIILQKHFRAYLLMKKERYKFRCLKHAVLLIQKWIRNIKEMQRIRNEYLIKRNAIIIIQKFWRLKMIMKKTRQQYIKVKNAIVTIQRWYKKIFIFQKFVPKERIDFLKKRNSAILIQCWIRRSLLMKKTREEYMNKLTAVKKLQQYFRATLIMKKHQEEFKEIKNATCILQKYFKSTLVGRKQREKYLKIRCATLIIQMHLRATLNMRKQMNKYIQMKKVTCIIQQHFRATMVMKKQREEFLNLRKATIICQRYSRATFTMKKERKKFLQKKKAVITIQRHYRSNILANKERNEYLNIKKAANILQHHMRAHLMMRKQRADYLLIRKAIMIIQLYFKATLVMTQQRFKYLRIKQATAVIQQRFRAYKTMKTQRNEFLKVKNATIIIQRYFRATVVMKRQRETFLSKKSAIIVLQRYFKATILMRIQRQYYLKIRKCIIVIQCYVRAALLMKRVRSNYLKTIRAVKIIQSHYRAVQLMRKKRNEYLKKVRAVKIIQERMFATILMKKERLKYLNILNAVKVIQIRFRANQLMHKHRREFLIKLNAIIIIQRYFRAYLDMKKQKYKYIRMLGAAKTIQKYFRATMMMRKQRKEYLQIIVAAQTIQINFRTWVVRKKYRNEFLLKKRAVCILSNYFKAILLAKKQRNAYLKILNATRVIQSRYRATINMRKTRQNYLRILNATRIIQNHWIATLIMRKVNREYIMMRQSTVILQSYFRATLMMKKQRNEYLRIIKAVQIVQDKFRANLMMRKQRREYLRLIEATKVIQRWFRKTSQDKIVFIQITDAVTKIQRCYRQYKYRMENSKEVQERKKNNDAASVIQAAWKGYKVRRDANESEIKVRKRLQELSNKSQSVLTIAERYNNAVAQLQSTGSMLEIIEAIMILDVLTRIYPKTCIDSCAELVDYLYLLLASSNRSIPHERACKYAVCVLINLVKFPDTKIFVWRCDHIDTLLTVMLRWCDKEGLLFPCLCTLVWLLCQDPEKASIFKKYPQTEQKLNKIFTKTKRLQTMLDNKTKKNISKKTFTLPAVTFDWKIVDNKQPRTFVDALYGITNVIKILNIKLNT